MIAAEPSSASGVPATGVRPVLWLKIQGNGSSNRVVRLLSGKTSIGSSPRCTICLPDAGIEPLHCLIVVEAQRVTIRPWASGTLLNGRTFDAAELAVGDVLSVGPIDIELTGERTEDGAASSEASGNDQHDNDQHDNEEQGVEAEPAAAADAEHLAMRDGSPSAFGHASDLQSANQPASEAFFEDDEPGPPADDATWLENCDLLRMVGTENSALGAEDLGPAIEYHVPTLEEWEWAASENARLSEELLQLAGAHERLIQELASIASDTTNVMNRLDESERRQATAAADDAIWRTQIQEWQEAFGGLEARLERLEQEVASSGRLNSANQASPIWSVPSTQEAPADLPDDDNLNAENSKVPDGESHATMESALEAPETEAEDVTADLCELPIWKQENQSDPADAGRKADGTDQPASEERHRASSSPSFGSFIERYAHMFEGEEQAGKDLTTSSGLRPQEGVSPHRFGESIPAPPPAESATVSDGDEESIEAYMSKLLQRVRGESDRGASAGRAICETPNVPSRPLPLPECAATDRMPRGFITNAGDIARRATAPEKTKDLESLRALANETARRAIGAHVSRTFRRDAITKFIVALLAGTTSLWLMLEAPHWSDLQFITACISLMAAVYWAGQTYFSFIESVRAVAYRGPQAKDGGKNPPSAPLPIDIEAP